jgi:hypothetical protein
MIIFLVGPCALDYSKMKTSDHFWTDPPADELVQRHRIHSSTNHITGPGSPKRPGLQVPVVISILSISMCAHNSLVFTIVSVCFSVHIDGCIPTL